MVPSSQQAKLLPAGIAERGIAVFLPFWTPLGDSGSSLRCGLRGWLAVVHGAAGAHRGLPTEGLGRGHRQRVSRVGAMRAQAVWEAVWCVWRVTGGVKCHHGTLGVVCAFIACSVRVVLPQGGSLVRLFTLIAWPCNFLP